MSINDSEQWTIDSAGKNEYDKELEEKENQLLPESKMAQKRKDATPAPTPPFSKAVNKPLMSKPNQLSFKLYGLY
jgi:hypothetical protein